jgi:mRNA-degrading endonuclease RelE of RelBE toxin-antitoxin system
MVYYYTSDFDISLNDLLAKKKDGYSSCKKDIKKLFNNLTFEQIWIQRDNILDNIPFRVIKSRIPNSGQRLSKSDGFRLIFILNRDLQEITFLYIYPKRGKYSKSNYTEAELERWIVKFNKESIDNTLKIYVF